MKTRNTALVAAAGIAALSMFRVALCADVPPGPPPIRTSEEYRPQSGDVTLGDVTTQSVRDDAVAAYARAGTFGFPKTRQAFKVTTSTGTRWWNSGGIFQNRERLLPTSGNPSYFEYDMYTRATQSTNRGPARIVIDVNHRFGGKYLSWYTTDHYASFKRFN
jgi:guanyl-specific ribonuclease Sa